LIGLYSPIILTIIATVSETTYKTESCTKCLLLRLLLTAANTEWSKKVSHYQESSWNRIKNRQCGYISHQFWV